MNAKTDPSVAARWWLDWPGAVFTWDLWYSCNYRCSYCWWEMDALWDKLAEQNRLLPPEEWGTVWDRVHERHGQARLDLLGGEPLLYPRFDELCRRLSRKHKLLITTNLSPATPKLERLLGGLDPERVHFAASFHPQFTSLDSFMEKTLLLKSSGFEPAALFVPWPPFLSRLEQYRAAFLAHDIPFSLMIFQGRHEGKDYPDAYTAGEKEALGQLTPNEAETKYRILRESTLGKLCHSGRVSANVKGNGDVYRCGQDAFGRKPMGNIFDPGFRLDDAPKPCPYRQCSCKEFRYLDELMPR
ncbi:MAG: radical SAM protein [Elusimicrobia bacterium]|nr:radical SAM protein [Elusimicrobiota bacterium]